MDDLTILRPDALLSPGRYDQLREPVVVIDGPLIKWVGESRDLPSSLSQAESVRIDGLLTPGLVNAHTHLQYTNFETVALTTYSGFEDWCIAFDDRFRASGGDIEWRAASRRGAALGIASGTTAFCDVVTDDSARGAFAEAGGTGVEYLEVIGEFESTWSEGRQRLYDRLGSGRDYPVGLSPHAPYSLDPAVIEDLCDIARIENVRIHSHVAESALERNLYESGDPAVIDIFDDHDKFELVRHGGRGLGTGQFCESLGLLNHRTHLAHGIYLNAEERAMLRAHDTAVALCPRSNAIIGLDEAPVAAYLREGNHLAIGTDSLASSPDLDVLSDAAQVVRIARKQGYRGDDLYARVFEAATHGGARAMGAGGIRGGYGMIREGMRANLAVFHRDARTSPLEQLLEDDNHECVLTVVDGDVRWSAPTMVDAVDGATTGLARGHA